MLVFANTSHSSVLQAHFKSVIYLYFQVNKELEPLKIFVSVVLHDTLLLPKFCPNSFLCWPSELTLLEINTSFNSSAFLFIDCFFSLYDIVLCIHYTDLLSILCAAYSFFHIYYLSSKTLLKYFCDAEVIYGTLTETLYFVTRRC